MRPAGTLYTVAAPSRACEACRRPLPADAAPQRALCDECRLRRRATSYLRAAHDLLVGVEPALAHEIDGLVVRLGAPS